MLSILGNLYEISLHISDTISSSVLVALPPAILGYIISIVSKNSLTVFYSNVIFALECKPNTSGSSSKGNKSMYVLQSFRLPYWGA